MQRNSGVMKYFKETEKVRYFKEKLQQLYDEMKAYHDRKINQSKNLEQMADISRRTCRNFKCISCNCQSVGE